MNTKQLLTSAAVAAVLSCAAPAYSQVLGGNAAGGLGGTLNGGLGGVSGAGQAMGNGSLGGTLDTDRVGRIGHTAETVPAMRTVLPLLAARVASACAGVMASPSLTTP